MGGRAMRGLREAARAGIMKHRSLRRMRGAGAREPPVRGEGGDPSDEYPPPTIIPRRDRHASALEVRGGIAVGQGVQNLRRIRKGRALSAEMFAAVAAENLLELIPCDTSAPVTVVADAGVADASGEMALEGPAAEKKAGGLTKGRTTVASSRGGGASSLAGPTTEMEDSLRSQVCEKLKCVDMWTQTVRVRRPLKGSLSVSFV